MYQTGPSGVSSAWRRETVLSVMGRASEERPMSWGSPRGSWYSLPSSGPLMTVSLGIGGG